MYKRNTRKLSLIIMISVMLMAGSVRATEESEPTCDQVLEACDLHVKTLEEERTLLYEQLGEKDKQIADLESEQSTLPWYVWFAIGTAVGVSGYGVLK